MYEFHGARGYETETRRGNFVNTCTKTKKMGLGRGDLYIDSENLERRLLYLSFANLNRFFSNKNEKFLYVVGFRLCW